MYTTSETINTPTIPAFRISGQLLGSVMLSIIVAIAISTTFVIVIKGGEIDMLLAIIHPATSVARISVATVVLAAAMAPYAGIVIAFAIILNTTNPAYSHTRCIFLSRATNVYPKIFPINILISATNKIFTNIIAGKNCTPANTLIAILE